MLVVFFVYEHFVIVHVYGLTMDKSFICTFLIMSNIHVYTIICILFDHFFSLISELGVFLSGVLLFLYISRQFLQGHTQFTRYLFNPLVTNGLSHPYHWDDSNFIFGVSGVMFYFYFIFRCKSY